MYEWHLVGMLSSFPDISLDSNGCKVLPGCKTLSIPKAKHTSRSKVNRLSDLDDQVLVFKYKGFIHAIDNVCRPAHGFCRLPKVLADTNHV